MKNKYKKYLSIAKKFNLCILEESIINCQFSKNIDFDKLFDSMTNKSNFTIQNFVNEYIIENILDNYENNYFFV